MVKILHPAILAQAETLARECPDEIITVLTLGGIYLYLSPSLSDLVGFTPEELLGRHYFDFIHPMDRKHLGLVVDDGVLTDVSVPGTFQGLLKPGGYRPMKGIAQAVQDPDSGEIFLLCRTEMIG